MLKRIPSCSSNQSSPALPHSARSFNPGLIPPSRSWPYGSTLQSSNASVRDLSGGRPKITANENLGQEFQPRRGNLRRGTLGKVRYTYTPVPSGACWQDRWESRATGFGRERAFALTFLRPNPIDLVYRFIEVYPLLSEGREHFEFLPTMDHRTSINFRDSLEDAVAELLPRVNSDMS
jgi:hypothetical protein